MMEKETLDHQYEEGNCYLRGTLFPGSMLEPTTALAEYAEKLGIDFYYETPAVQLVADGGKVSGVIGRAKNGSHICFHANKGVILATGDYQNNAAMVARYCPDAALFEKKQFAKTGDGQLMGMLIGAELEPITHTKMIHAKATSVMREEPLLAVNDNGERFVAEDVPYDVSKTHVSELIGEAFRCSHIVLASITYNMGIFTPMKNFLLDLEAHNLQNRTFAFVENGSWSPVSGRLMKEIVDRLAGCTVVGDAVTILSSPDNGDSEALAALAEAVSNSVLEGDNAPAATEEAASKKWVCKICGYVYEGDEVPEDYKCPICGAGKDAFTEA